MSAYVPLRPPKPNVNQIKSTAVVSGKVFEDTAALHNWNVGRGAQLIPFFCPNYSIAEGDTRTFKFYTYPRFQAFDWVWCVTARSEATDEAAVFRLASPSGGTEIEYSTPNKREQVFPVTYKVVRASQTSSLGEVSLTIEAITNGLFVESVGLWEVPRVGLEIDNNDKGVDVDSERFRQPIYAETGQGMSVGGLGQYVRSSLDIARRVGLFAYAWPTEDPHGGDGLGASNALFKGPVPIIPRKIYRTSTVQTVQIAVLAKTASTGAGTLTFTAAQSADTATISYTSSDTSYTWKTGIIDFQCEDLSVGDGRRGSVWETCTIAKDQTAGTFQVASINIIEVP